MQAQTANGARVPLRPTVSHGDALSAELAGAPACTLPLPYSPTALAAFSRNKDPSRM